jgi:hypothetical protein
VRAGDGGVRRRAEERHRDLQLLAEDGERPGHAGLAAGGERPRIGRPMSTARVPSIVVDGSTVATSTSTRGRNR